MPERTFDTPRAVACLLAEFDHLWAIAGGWALDLYLGRVTREHHDVDIAILRRDQQVLRRHLLGWQFFTAIPPEVGRLDPWAEDEWLEPPIHEIHARRVGAQPETLEILLDESAGDHWLFRKKTSITRPLARAFLTAQVRIPILAPEIVLLYKAATREPRPEDEQDFVAGCAILDGERRAWLHDAIKAWNARHRWLDVLEV